MDEVKRERLVQKLSELPDEPLISLDEFFDGNDDEGSIGCNLMEHPGVQVFRDTLRRVAALPDVQEVLVQITEADPGFGAWPFSDTIYVVGDVTQVQLKETLVALAPDEIEPIKEHLPMALASHAGPVFFVWWD